jgi:hypothetical protein
MNISTNTDTETETNIYTFGDFTLEELNDIGNVNNTKTQIHIHHHHHYYHSPSHSHSQPTNSHQNQDNHAITIQFGDFTAEECSKFQDNSTIQIQPYSPNRSNTWQQQQHHPKRYYTESKFNKIKNCERCGYNSHELKDCHASRHRLGMYLGNVYHYHHYHSPPSPFLNYHHRHPFSPTPIPLTHVNGTMYFSSPYDFDPNFNKILKKGDLVFSSQDISEWIEEDLDYMEQHQVHPYIPDLVIEDYLYLDHLTTNLMIDSI